jgi:hypothetical protein
LIHEDLSLRSGGKEEKHNNPQRTESRRSPNYLE